MCPNVPKMFIEVAVPVLPVNFQKIALRLLCLSNPVKKRDLKSNLLNGFKIRAVILN